MDRKELFLIIAKKKHDPNAKLRNRGDVVFPAGSKNVKDDKDHFPINNENQARNALSRVAQYSSVPPWYSGSLESLQSAVRNAVKRKYSNIEVTKPGAKAFSDEAFLMVVRADGDGGGDDGDGDEDEDEDETPNMYLGPQKRGGGQPEPKKKKKKK